jgi:hypothetical protein
MSKMSLTAVTTGKVQEPYALTVYGVHGCGKSTFAAGAPDPIFLPCENGSGHLDVARFPQPESWADIRAAVQTLLTEKHSYRTLIVDTLDAAEALCWKQVMDADTKFNPKSLEEVGGGYGKGASQALVLWRGLLADLDLLIAKGMNVILVAHSQVKKFKSPDLAIEPFDRYEMRLAPTAAALISAWPKAVLFACYEVMSTEKDGRTLGVSTGKRLLYTQHRAAWDAKNRYALPESLPLSWDAFDKAAMAGLVKQGDATMAAVKALIAKAGPELAKQANEALAKVDNDVKLEKLLAWLRGKVS